jgi:hypothetical protein
MNSVFQKLAGLNSSSKKPLIGVKTLVKVRYWVEAFNGSKLKGSKSEKVWKDNYKINIVDTLKEARQFKRGFESYRIKEYHVFDKGKNLIRKTVEQKIQL